jgi:hypothetical protein
MFFFPLEHLHKMQYPGIYSEFVPSVYQWVLKHMRKEDPGTFPFIPAVCNNIRNVISVSILIFILTFFSSKIESIKQNDINFNFYRKKSFWHKSLSIPTLNSNPRNYCF